jgi:nitrate/nitrite-specific signal transduction histidine kinase
VVQGITFSTPVPSKFSLSGRARSGRKKLIAWKCIHRALGDELASQDSAAFRLVLEGTARELHPIPRDEMYRIAREALRNAFRHARATQIEAEIAYGPRMFRVRIRDDGQGIPPAVLKEGRSGHYGLAGMRERAAQIGAKLNIWSGLGAGTEVELSIPGAIAYGTSPGRPRFWPFPGKVK